MYRIHNRSPSTRPSYIYTTCFCGRVSFHHNLQVLSGFNSIILARVNAHKDVEELKMEASVPVINALSDLHHPLQTLADLMTIQVKRLRDNMWPEQ